MSRRAADSGRAEAKKNHEALLGGCALKAFLLADDLLEEDD